MRLTISIAAAAVLLAVLGWRSGSVRGASAAILDNIKGQPKSYAIGCTNDWPREPQAFRVREILNRDYHMEFLTVGGVVPSPFVVAYADSYDAVSYKLLCLRYGKTFANDVERQAATDIFEHHVVLEGCNWGSRQLVLPDRDIIAIDGDPQVMLALAANVKKTVRLTGTMTDVRGSIWRSAGRPEIRAAEVQILGAPCGRQ